MSVTARPIPAVPAFVVGADVPGRVHTTVTGTGGTLVTVVDHAADGRLR